MVPHPTATSFHFCEKVVFENVTLNATLVNTFSVLRLSEFPASPPVFLVYVVLHDGLGEGKLNITMTRLETNEDIYQESASVSFAQRFAESRTGFDFRAVEFYAPGDYMVTIDVDGEWVADRRLYVRAQEATP